MNDMHCTPASTNYLPLQTDLLNEWQQCLVKDVDEELCIRDPLKDTDTGSSSFANPCPYVDFRGMLWPIRKCSGHARIKLLYVCMHIGLLLSVQEKRDGYSLQVGPNGPGVAYSTQLNVHVHVPII